MPVQTEKRSLFANPALQENFDKDGYIVIDFLNRAEVSDLADEFWALPSAMGQPAFASTIMSHDTGYRNTVSKIIKSAFTRAVNETFEDTQLFLGNFNLKYPGNPSGTVQMHQDPSFVDERAFSSLVVWVPLVDTTQQNGALQVIPGSHKILNQPRCGGLSFPYEHLEAKLLEQFGKELLMKAGQAYIASPALFHFSPPNMGTSPRIAAAGLAGPSESTLRYHHYTEKAGRSYAEVFATEHDYYVAAPLFSKPDESRYQLIDIIALDNAIPSEDALFEMLTANNQI